MVVSKRRKTGSNKIAWVVATARFRYMHIMLWPSEDEILLGMSMNWRLVQR